MAFIDILAFYEVTLVFAAVVIGYVSVRGLFAIRKNDATGLTSALKGSAVPLGAIGGAATFIGLWSEIAWPLPGSYNILFSDVYLLFGVTLVILAVSVAYSLKLQYAGLFALVAGGMSIAYGWNGYQLGMTKEPFDMFLLYAGFGLMGILALPATALVDHYLANPASVATPRSVAATTSVARPTISLHGATRAVQPITAGAPEQSAEEPTPSVLTRFRVPIYFNVAFIVFVVSVALAGIAALWFLDTTLPAHLASAP